MNTSESTTWSDALAAILKGRVAVMCVGNALRGDDGVGPEVARLLAVEEPWKVFDAGVAPENWIGPVCAFNPDAVAVIDAMDFGASPGTIRRHHTGDLAEGCTSTHDASLALTLGIIRHETGSAVVIIGIQPETLAFGAGLTPAAQQAATAVADELTHLSSRPPHSA